MHMKTAKHTSRMKATTPIRMYTTSGLMDGATKLKSKEMRFASFPHRADASSRAREAIDAKNRPSICVNTPTFTR